MISKELGLAENELCTFAEEYFSKRHVSAAYLTGEGFDVEKLPERFAKLMVTRRKAFVGQNLLQGCMLCGNGDIEAGSV